MIYNFESNVLELKEYGTSLVVHNLTNGVKMIMPNFKLPETSFEFETIILVGGRSLLE